MANDGFVVLVFGAMRRMGGGGYSHKNKFYTGIIYLCFC